MAWEPMSKDEATKIIWQGRQRDPALAHAIEAFVRCTMAGTEDMEPLQRAFAEKGYATVEDFREAMRGNK